MEEENSSKQRKSQEEYEKLNIIEHHEQYTSTSKMGH
jgi:hypothetical protein